MSVPNYANVPKSLFATGLYNLKTEDGQAAFTDACVSTLHGIDENWGHLIKKPSQTDIHDHGEDSALYKLPNNQARAVDFIGGAGGSNPQPGWIVDEVTPYTHEDWFDPTDHGIFDAPPPPPPALRIPSYGELGDDAFFRAMVGVPLFADYATADAQGHPDAKPNDGMAAWFSRPIYRLMAAMLKANGQPIDPMGEVRIVRNEWRAILKLPPI